MSPKIMVLPSRDPHKPRLVSIPEDTEAHEAFRYATGMIAEVEESNPDYSWEDIEEALEARGFISVPYILGPELD